MESFDRFVETTASSTSSWNLTRTVPGLSFVTDSSPTFVGPDLSGVDDLAGKAVAIVSAPAAAGKSTIARQLAVLRQGLLLDLAQYNVGNHFLPGALYEAFGDGVGEVLRAISEGRLLLILDALDETQLRSGESNFEAFIEDLAAFAQGAKGEQTSIVALARGETAELVSLMFEDANVALGRVGIMFWTRQQSEEFIDLFLDTRGERHRLQRDLFEGARDALWSVVTEVASSSEDEQPAALDSFLGYPPVVLALAEYLDVDNFFQLRKDLDQLGSAAEGRSGAWGLVATIVEAILDRERGKVVDRVKDRLEPLLDDDPWSDWGSLYTHLEQCVRVYDWVLKRPTSHAQLPSLPVKLREEYLSSVDMTVPQHPFVGGGRDFASVVFRDYATALVLAKGASNEQAAARADMQSRNQLATPLLGRFLLDFVGEGHLSGEDLGLVYESLLAQAPTPASVSFTMEESGDDAVATATVELSGTAESVISFLVATDDSPAAFYRRLRSAFLDVSLPIVLGVSGGDFFLGPDVELSTSLLEVQASAVHVVRDKETAVVLEASEYSEGGGPPELKLHGEGLFGVRWSPIGYPWGEHVLEDRHTDPADENTLEAFKHLSHILRYFVRHGRGELKSGRQLIDNVAVGRTAERKAVFDRLLGAGVIVPGATEYKVDVDAMAREGINYSDLRTRTLTPEIKKFLSG